MAIDLFAFDFTEENKGLITEEKILNQFEILQNMFKKKRNAYFYSLKDLPNDMMVYLDEFKKRGWIEERGNGINIVDQHLKYHTVEEITNEFKKMIDTVLSNPDVNYYKDVLPVINSGATPIRYKDEKTKNEINQAKKEIIKDTVIKLGLKHFLDNPSARGYKINPFSSKWPRENVLPIIAEKVIPMTDYDDIDNYFKKHVFFFGRRDWDRSGYRKDYDIPPYPEYVRLMPSCLEIASLCEAKDKDTVKLILDYSGCSFGHEEKQSNLTYVYPKGWSYEKYLESLSKEDLYLIKEDQERIKKLRSAI